MNRHEGKLTGLAAWGDPVLADEIGVHFSVDDDGVVSSDFATYADMRDAIKRIADGHLRKKRAEHPDDTLTGKADVAASIQRVLEDKVLRSVSTLVRKYRIRKLGLAGGVFANVRLNRLLCEQTGVDEVFIFPGMGDEGLAVGGAHDWLVQRKGMAAWAADRQQLHHVCLGRDYEDAVPSVFFGHPDCRSLGQDIAVQSSALLAAGWVGALYHGRMEFGPRALGARSILASPVDHTINTTINERLQRTEFMPFAPCVLEEDASRVFVISDANRHAARFMTITCDVQADWRERIPAVVHVDGTATPADCPGCGPAALRRDPAFFSQQNRPSGPDKYQLQCPRRANHQYA